MKGITEVYFGGVALTDALLRGGARRVERLGWELEAVKAARVPLAVVSNKKTYENFMFELYKRTPVRPCI